MLNRSSNHSTHTQDLLGHLTLDDAPGEPTNIRCPACITQNAQQKLKNSLHAHIQASLDHLTLVETCGQAADIGWDIYRWTTIQLHTACITNAQQKLKPLYTHTHTHTGFAVSSDIRWGTWRGYQHKMGHLDRQWPSYTLHASLRML